MDRSEKYATILVFATILACTLFFSALVYMDNYHEVRPLGMTVSVVSDGYIAQDGVIDYYPYVSSKAQLVYGAEFSGENASEVIQWAIDNADGVYFKQGHYFLNGTIKVDSGSKLDGDFTTHPSPYFSNFNISTPKAIFVVSNEMNYAFETVNITSPVTISNLGFLTEDQYLSGVDF